MAFKCMMVLAPEYLGKKFISRGNISGRATRSSQQLNIPLFLKVKQGSDPFLIELLIYEIIYPGAGGGGGSYFPYTLLNIIEAMFSQLAKQSHRKLSADCSIAHEHIRRSCRPPCEHVFQRKPKKWQSMAKV